MLRGSKSDTVRRGHHGGLKRRRDRAGGYRQMARAPFRVGQKQNDFRVDKPWQLPNDRPDVGDLAGDVDVNVKGYEGVVGFQLGIGRQPAKHLTLVKPSKYLWPTGDL